MFYQSYFEQRLANLPFLNLFLLFVITPKLLNVFASKLLTLCKIYFYTFSENFILSSIGRGFEFPVCQKHFQAKLSNILKIYFILQFKFSCDIKKHCQKLDLDDNLLYLHMMTEYLFIFLRLNSTLLSFNFYLTNTLRS